MKAHTSCMESFSKSVSSMHPLRPTLFLNPLALSAIVMMANDAS